MYAGKCSSLDKLFARLSIRKVPVSLDGANIVHPQHTRSRASAPHLRACREPSHIRYQDQAKLTSPTQSGNAANSVSRSEASGRLSEFHAPCPAFLHLHQRAVFTESGTVQTIWPFHHGFRVQRKKLVRRRAGSTPRVALAVVLYYIACPTLRHISPTS